ncbi:hypothetical protein [Vibrio cholerae]|uniref:hypothetical protein n=1 Tax=Vibrio cholerae TaxID=666 RepID=UPI000615A61D|nr:hypothetical protein [Vibrio cholerae]AKB05609.1 iclR helix-turn-helix domain protein [Vibrio cholerae]GHY89370.1 iclR helix-turn-helix domain protein [Vibrio cholerae]
MRHIRYEYQGVKGLKAISELTGIPESTLSQRINKWGMTIKEAVSHQVMKKIRYEYQGAKGLKAISELTGIPVPTLSQRINKCGMTIEEAVGHQRGALVAKQQHEYQGLVGLAEISRHYGILLTTLHYRVQTKGMSIEDALSNAACKASPKKGKAKSQAPVKAKKECKKHGTNKPDLLHPLWKLALGIAA